MEKFGGERNCRKADVKSFQEEVALALSSEGRAAEQPGAKALTKTGVVGRMQCRRLGALAWPLGC